MDLKNKYLFSEEIVALIENLGNNSKEITEAILLIYDKGYKIRDALKESQVKIGLRAVQKRIAKVSKGLINLQDIRRAYLFNNPQPLSKKIRQREPISARLRWKILCKDNFKCRACGISSKDSVLHVDHIYPLSLGGITEESNLRTLCSKCNMGKGKTLLEIEITERKQEQ